MLLFDADSLRGWGHLVGAAPKVVGDRVREAGRRLVGGEEVPQVMLQILLPE